VYWLIYRKLKREPTYCAPIVNGSLKPIHTQAIHSSCSLSLLLWKVPTTLQFSPLHRNQTFGQELQGHWQYPQQQF
jgi:hypothetical protein